MRQHRSIKTGVTSSPLHPHGPTGGVFISPACAGVDGPQPSVALMSGLLKVDLMIMGAQLPYPTAAANLKHWRDGTGQDRKISAGLFTSQSFFLDHLRNVHRPEFDQGAQSRLGLGTLTVGPEGRVSMEWADSLYAPRRTDLYFALGGFTVHSKVVVEAEVKKAKEVKESKEVKKPEVVVRFVSWRVQVSDVYDWDPGKLTQIPGIGRVSDEEMLAMEKAGYGRHYRIRTDWATIEDTEITRPMTFAEGSY